MGTLVALRSERTRQDFTSYLGMVVFLASWAMMFAALFLAYGMVRARAVAWPPGGREPLPLLLPGFNTGVVVASSVLLHNALRRVRLGKATRLSWFVAAVMALGVLFLALQLVVWVRMWREGLVPSSGPYASVFYALTAFHALHVVAGIGVLGYVLRAALRDAYSAARHVPVRLAAMFWHFVGVIWVFLYLLVYVA